MINYHMKLKQSISDALTKHVLRLTSILLITILQLKIHKVTMLCSYLYMLRDLEKTTN